ncbi:hypothetical protein L210DRAFT_3639436 [Boletus edulis BED1]|uniref:BTB/POZ domain-containing protein n=1 Tax=Boletus edulis BED1 TaxID=1328754 RepID=A0AAD4C6A4_BOLED|nr:hypothetical protein L210DRAFT_3639436 [Boletus edulis BED1]
MILSSRVHRSPHTHASYPTNSELAPCYSTPEPLASPPTTPPRGHKHSFSSITWLNRSSSATSSHSAPYPAPKPTRISEPKFRSSLEQLNFHRVRPLGSGATIVRTPQEALFGSTDGTFAQTTEVAGLKQDIMHEAGKNESRLLSVPPSPPLPSLPDILDTEGDGLSSNPATISLSDHRPPPRSSSSPSSSSSPPTLLEHSRTPSCSTATLPADTNLFSPPPPFEAILLSPIPEGAINPSKFIVTLETCTTTYRTTLRSLASRPSHLSRYITSLLSPMSETTSVYSNSSDASSGQNSSDFSAFFRDYLASSGCLPQPSGIHVFLDRPSAPYTHLLAYLRSAPSTPEHSESLPLAVQLGTSPSDSRLESLHELREEASYLGLVDLDMLCCHEIHRFQRVLLPAFSTGGTPRGKTGSVHSVRTVVEECQSRKEPVPSALPLLKCNGTYTTKSATREYSSGSSFENKHASVRERGRQRRGIKYEVGSPPPGWI